MTLPRLPRFRRGQPITAEALNAMVDAVERSRVSVGESSGLGASSGPGGTSIYLAAPKMVIKATTTSAIGPLTSATAPGSGTFIERVFNGTAKANGALTGTCYNDHDKTIASGSEVMLAKDNTGHWWVIDVDKCTNLS